MESENLSCCFTGYRPQKFPFPLEQGNAEYTAFENQLCDTIFKLIKNGCKSFYCGMAMGFDLIAAEIVLEARRAVREEVSLISVIPFLEQAKYFDRTWRMRYERVLTEADERILISDRYFKGCYLKRNHFMIDNSDCVLTWFDGVAGGTKSTLNYAERKNRSIINLYKGDAAVGVHRLYTLSEEQENFGVAKSEKI